MPLSDGEDFVADREKIAMKFGVLYGIGVGPGDPEVFRMWSVLARMPASDGLDVMGEVLTGAWTLILMKVGRRLNKVLDFIERAGFLDRAVYVARAWLEGRQVEVNLRKLRQQKQKADYLSILLTHTWR